MTRHTHILIQILPSTAFIISLLFILPIYINTILIFHRFFDILSLELINQITIYALIIVSSIGLFRLGLLAINLKQPAWIQIIINYNLHKLDQTTLRLVYWLVDSKRTFPELIQKEFFRFKHYWFEWIKLLITENKLIPNQVPSSQGWSSIRYDKRSFF